MTHDMITEAQEAIDLAQAAYTAAQDAYALSSSARANMEISVTESGFEVDAATTSYLEKNNQITNRKHNAGYG